MEQDDPHTEAVRRRTLDPGTEQQRPPAFTTVPLHLPSINPGHHRCVTYRPGGHV